MEPIREILHANLQELGLNSDEVEYHKCGLRRYVFSYVDSWGGTRFRKIVMRPDDKYGTDEGVKTIEWLTYLGIENFIVLIETDYQIIDTPFIGHDLYNFEIGKSFRIPFQPEYYIFNGFNRTETVEWLAELENRLLEFQRLTGLVHTDLFSTGRPNNIVWNPYDPSFPRLNVIDCESFQIADMRNLAKFHGRWETAKDYIIRNYCH
jgi:hypothetical protein